MNRLSDFAEFVSEHYQKILFQTLQHIGLTTISLLLSIVISIPLGVVIARRVKLAPTVLGFASVFQTIPSIALLGFLIPFTGIGPVPAILSLFLYSLLPIIRNTYTGINSIDVNIREAGMAMGMSKHALLTNVELPLAMPVILAGIRTAAVINIGVATMAAYIAAGGLGEFIFGGISLNNTDMILAGALPAALLAIGVDYGLSLLQKIRFKKLSMPILLFAILGAMAPAGILPGVSHTTLLAGYTAEFMGREDGYLNLKDVYDLNINSVVVNDAVMYEAVHEKELDVISGYSTDGRVRAFDLAILEDDKKIFPPYNAALVIKSSTLEKYSELQTVLNMMSSLINDSVMTELNYKADYLHEDPEKIAKDFLLQHHLWRQPGKRDKGLIRIGSKIFAEQYILIHMYAMLIEGYTDLKAKPIPGLGGTKICFEALLYNQIDVYPEYTGTGLLAILQVDDAILQSLAGDSERTYRYVNDEFEKRYGIEWLEPIGFNNAYALMMRRNQMKQLGASTISDLVRITKKQ